MLESDPNMMHQACVTELCNFFSFFPLARSSHSQLFIDLLSITKLVCHSSPKIKCEVNNDNQEPSV